MRELETTTMGALLRRYRLAAGFSQTQLAARAGLSADTIAALERGRHVAPRPETARLLAEALSLEPGEHALHQCAPSPRSLHRRAHLSALGHFAVHDDAIGRPGA